MADAPVTHLTAAFWDYDRTLPLASGRVVIPGVSLDCTILRPEECFARAMNAEFDITELSFSNTLTSMSLGPFPYLLIPVFPSRAFRHATFFVRTDRGIATPGDLAGKTVGVAEYDMTAAVVARGLLRDRYGVMPQDLRWRVGDQERTKPQDLPLQPPPGVEISISAPDRGLEERLLSGEVDAVISLRPLDAIRRQDPRVRPLFADIAREEQEYFRQTGIFPIMHVVGIRKSLVEGLPGLPALIFQAFCKAKDLAIAELDVLQSPKITLPWVRDALQQTRAVLGQNYWPYGLAANRRTLEAQIRWSREDGLQAHALTVEDLFTLPLEE